MNKVARVLAARGGFSIFAQFLSSLLGTWCIAMAILVLVADAPDVTVVDMQIDGAAGSDGASSNHAADAAAQRIAFALGGAVEPESLRTNLSPDGEWTSTYDLKIPGDRGTVLTALGSHDGVVKAQPYGGLSQLAFVAVVAGALLAFFAYTALSAARNMERERTACDARRRGGGM